MTSSQAFIPSGHAANTLRCHIGATLRLALPVMVARAGILVLVAVDIAMTGHAGAVELAYYGLAMAPQIPMLVVGIGLLMGTVVLTAQADGANRSTKCGAVWRISLVHAAAYGVVFVLLSQGGERFLALTGQAPDLARGGGHVLVMFGWGLPAMLLYAATTSFLEGIKRPMPGMVVMLLANLLNVGLNWLFIYGNWGMPALGAEGAALATTIVRWFMFVAIAHYALGRVNHQQYGVSEPIADARGVGRRLRRIGYPIALTHGIETSAFAFVTLFAGLLGAHQVGGYQVAMNLVALPFMCTLGFATAASVRVANAVGRCEQAEIPPAGWIPVALVALLLASLGGVYYSIPQILAAIYTNDPAVATVAIPTISVAAFVLVPAGAQGVLMGALRGTADVWPAALLYFFSFWLLMIPLAYVLGVVEEGGAPVLMIAVSIGCFTAALLLAVRFRVVARRAVARV